MLYKPIWISVLSLLTIPATANLNPRAASPSASSSSAQLILANEAAATSSYNPDALLPTQLSALFQTLQISSPPTPSPTPPSIIYDTGSITLPAAATSLLSASIAAEQSTAIIIPPPIINPLTAAPPPEITSAPYLYFGSSVNEYYVIATASSVAPYPVVNTTTSGSGISPEIVPFTGEGCGRWDERGSGWRLWAVMMGCGGVVLLFGRGIL